MYIGVPWKILDQIQKLNVCKFRCNSASGDDVDHSLGCGGCGFLEVFVLFLLIRVPFVAKIIVRIHSVI